MKNTKLVGILGALIGAIIIMSTCNGEDAIEKMWQKSIDLFAEKDINSPPPADPILCVGSSSFAVWESMEQDMSPLPVINRGFGGSRIVDVLYYFDKLIIKYQPKIILIYEGDNDHLDISPVYFAQLCEVFAKRVHKELPDTKIIFVSIKPSVRRWKLWPKMQRANKLVSQFADSKDYLGYIDITDTLLGPDGKPIPELFREQEMNAKLHLTEEAYERWTAVIKPVLEKEYKKIMAKSEK